MDSQPSAECDSDIPGLQTYTESVRFLETYTGNPELRRPGLTQKDKMPTMCDTMPSDNGAVERASGHLLSMTLKLTLGLVVAYSESQEVRQVVDPVLNGVSEPAQAVGKAAGKVAVTTGKLALETGRFVGHQTLAASKVVGHQALATGKVVGAGVGQATVASSKTLGESSLLAGQAVARMLFGESSPARIGVVGGTGVGGTGGADAGAIWQDPRAVYQFVGEKRDAPLLKLNAPPNVGAYPAVEESRARTGVVGGGGGARQGQDSPKYTVVGFSRTETTTGVVETTEAAATTSSYLCGLDRVTAIVGTSLVSIASAGTYSLHLSCI